jgi:hypothetical protein
MAGKKGNVATTMSQVISRTRVRSSLPTKRAREASTAWVRGLNQATDWTHDGSWSSGKKMPEKRKIGVTTRVK